MNQFRYSVGQLAQDFATFKLHGPDTETFLQVQSTYNISLLSEGAFHLASFLDPQGRIECYGWLLRNGKEFTYLVPVSLQEQALERLNRYLISEDVTIEGPVVEKWWIAIGAEAFEHKRDHAHAGSIFADDAVISRNEFSGVAMIPSEDQTLWRGLTGWPSFDGSDYQKEIINNNRLFDLSVSENKGCYPGQETVSKIATRRGAAYSPVLLETRTSYAPGILSSFGNKMGEVKACYAWANRFYLSASVLRDFRVAGMKLSASVGDQSGEFVVRYFPLLSGTRTEKAQELFYEATDAFTKGQDDIAESLFKQALRLDSTHADTLESLGVLLGRLQRFDEAIEIMKKLAEAHPSSVLAHTNMSVFLMKLGKIEEAEEQKSLATVKSFQKFGAEAKEKEAIEAEKKKKMDEWLKRESMFQQVLEIDADDTLANYGIGSIAVEKGEWERARTHLEKVLKADPKYSVAYLALGKAYSSLGMKTEALTTYREGIKIAASKGDLMPANQMQFELDRLS